MRDEEKIIRGKTLKDFNRELGRYGGETQEVLAWVPEQYGIFPEDVGGDGHGGTLKQVCSESS